MSLWYTWRDLSKQFNKISSESVKPNLKLLQNSGFQFNKELHYFLSTNEHKFISNISKDIEELNFFSSIDKNEHSVPAAVFHDKLKGPIFHEGNLLTIAKPNEELILFESNQMPEGRAPRNYLINDLFINTVFSNNTHTFNHKRLKQDDTFMPIQEGIVLTKNQLFDTWFHVIEGLLFSKNSKSTMMTFAMSIPVNIPLLKELIVPVNQTNLEMLFQKNWINNF